MEPKFFFADFSSRRLMSKLSILEDLGQWPLEQMSSPCQHCHSDNEMDFQHEQMGNYPPLHSEGLYLYGVAE